MISVRNDAWAIKTVDELCRSGQTSFIGSNGHIYVIGPKHVYDVTNYSMSINNDSFVVQRFCDLEIKII